MASGIIGVLNAATSASIVYTPKNLAKVIVNALDAATSAQISVNGAILYNGGPSYAVPLTFYVAAGQTLTVSTNGTSTGAGIVVSALEEIN